MSRSWQVHSGYFGSGFLGLRATACCGAGVSPAGWAITFEVSLHPTGAGLLAPAFWFASGSPASRSQRGRSVVTGRASTTLIARAAACYWAGRRWSHRFARGVPGPHLCGRRCGAGRCFLHKYGPGTSRRGEVSTRSVAVAASVVVHGYGFCRRWVRASRPQDGRLRLRSPCIPLAPVYWPRPSGPPSAAQRRPISVVVRW